MQLPSLACFLQTFFIPPNSWKSEHIEHVVEGNFLYRNTVVEHFNGNLAVDQIPHSVQLLESSYEVSVLHTF